MQRCENELINKISAQNVTDILIKLHPHLKRPSKHANVVEDAELLQMQIVVKQKFEEQLDNILTVAKSFFLLEF